MTVKIPMKTIGIFLFLRNKKPTTLLKNNLKCDIMSKIMGIYALNGKYKQELRKC